MMAAHGRLLFLACCAAFLGLALSALPVRNAGDCVNSNLLKLTGSVYPILHQIQRPAIQERTTVTVAQNFDIVYGSTYKIVSNVVGSSNETYVLYQCGTEAPDLSQLGLPSTTKVFSVPLVATKAPDTTVLNFMKLLGIQDRVAYVTTNAVDSCMQVLSSPLCNRTSSNAPADAVDGVFDFSKNDKDSKAIMFAATAERGPLHAAEYIKYVASFFNREATANKVFANIYNAYNDIYTAVQELRASSIAVRPVVAWLYYQKAYPTYNLTDQIQIKFHGFRPQYTGDAGGVLPDLAKLKNSSLVDGVNIKINYADDILLLNLDSNETIAALRAILANVDVAIDESYVEGDVTQYTLESFLARYRLNYPTASTDIKFLANKALLRLDGTANAAGMTAWFEEAVARPDVVLHDLVYFISPAVLKSLGDTTAPRLVRNLFPALTATPGTTNGVFVLTATQCPLTAGQCSPAAKAICPAMYLDCNGKLVTATDAQPCAPSCPTATPEAASKPPTSKSPEAGSPPAVSSSTLVSSPGAAGRAVFAPVMLLALLATAMAAVMGPFGAWL